MFLSLYGCKFGMSPNEDYKLTLNRSSILKIFILKMANEALNLPIIKCLLIDAHNNRTQDICSLVHPLDCVRCSVRSDYITGESVNDYHSLGLIVCNLLWTLIVLIGTIGVIGNCLIIITLKQRLAGKQGFNRLLLALAVFDVSCCAMTIPASTSYLFYLGNWSGRGIVTLYTFYLSWIRILFGKLKS